MFTRTVTDHWIPAAAVPAPAGAHRIVVDDSLPPQRAANVLTPVTGDGIVTITADLAARFGLTGASSVAPDVFARAVADTGLRFHGADHLWYLPADTQDGVLSAPVPPRTRELSEADADAFAALVADTPDPELDEAFVELDHWVVHGTFDGDRLACAASMYPWRDTRLADIGVVTVPRFRGRGHARATVRSLSAEALRRGLEPQYRCQTDNTTSMALAASAGFVRFATWDVVVTG